MVSRMNKGCTVTFESNSNGNLLASQTNGLLLNDTTARVATTATLKARSIVKKPEFRHIRLWSQPNPEQH